MVLINKHGNLLKIAFLCPDIEIDFFTSYLGFTCLFCCESLPCCCTVQEKTSLFGSLKAHISHIQALQPYRGAV